MREYETIYLLKADLPQDQLTELRTKFNDTITVGQGQILAEGDWGKRRLAYEVAKQKHGYYIYLRYAAPGELVARLERLLKLEDTVLKFLTVKLADEVREAAKALNAEAPEEIIYERPSPAPRRPYRSHDDRPRRSHHREDSAEGQAPQASAEQPSAEREPQA